MCILQDGKNAYKIAKESDTSNPEVVSLLEVSANKALLSIVNCINIYLIYLRAQPRPEFLRVLPEGWDVFKDKQTLVVSIYVCTLEKLNDN